MLQVESFRAIKRIITREYDTEGRLVKEQIQEFEDVPETPAQTPSPSFEPITACTAG